MTTTANRTDLESDADVFRVLGHETRLRLLMLLTEREHSVGELDSVSGIGQPGLSQQLAVLRKAQLVLTRRVAKQVYYRADPAALARIAALLTGLAEAAASAGPARRPVSEARHAGGSSAGFVRML
jgi:DNA-binding transcriptional ArsR family regulator